MKTNIGIFVGKRSGQLTALLRNNLLKFLWPTAQFLDCVVSLQPTTYLTYLFSLLGHDDVGEKGIIIII